MIAYLIKSDASKGFEQILDFFNSSVIQRKVIITEDTVRQALHLDDAESIDCLPNEEIFSELARMGYEKPSTKKEAADDVANVAVDDVVVEDATEPTPPSPTPTTTPPPPQELPQDKIAQALEITKVKQRVRKLEKKNKLKVSRLRRLKKIGTAQRVESSADTVMDDQEDASKQGGDNS
nr:hypothetical protein [Tanacetum cinerariifolium]